MLSHNLRRAVNAASGPTDPNFRQTTLLMQGDGTNGAQNNTFLDSSTNNFTITRNGNTTQGTFTPFSVDPYGWSTYFDGGNTNQTLTFPQSTLLNFGTGDFTVECWYYSKTGGSNQQNRKLLDTRSASTLTSWHLGFESGALGMTNAGNSFTVASPGIVIATWYHIAYSRQGTTGRLFLNGALIGTFTDSSTYNVGSGTTATIGRAYVFSSGTGVYGYISNMRVVNGTAVYTSAFTPPTTPLTAITNTAVLTCQNNNFFKDNSSNNLAITPSGAISIQPFSPFAPTAAYSASANSGSGYFDGSGDFLSIANNTALDLSSGNFTIEAWVYWTGTNPIGNIVNKDGLVNLTYASYSLNLNGSGFMQISVGSGNSAAYLQTVTSNRALSTNTWTHFAAVKNGTTLTLYQNGTSVASATQTGTIVDGGKALLIGYHSGYNANYYWGGYISNLRILKGTALYTANFTPPTTPLTAITNTSLLCNFTNGGIFDNAKTNIAETVGTAQISTSVVKYGTGSIYVPAGAANTNFVKIRSAIYDNLSVFFEGSDFTIEFWYNAGTLVANTSVLAKANTSNIFGTFLFSQTGTGLTFSSSSNGASWDLVNGASILTSMSANTWYYVAVTKQGSTWRTFADGVLIASVSNPNAPIFPNTPITINYHASATQGETYIDSLRITSGIARYTATFTPPTAPFPNQ